MIDVTPNMPKGAAAAILDRLEDHSPWFAEVLARAAFEGAGLLPSEEEAEAGREPGPAHAS